jgi:hypothetical protein
MSEILLEAPDFLRCVDILAICSGDSLLLCIPLEEADAEEEPRVDNEAVVGFVAGVDMILHA